MVTIQMFHALRYVVMGR
uniref:Uncharacterized protein n=1 Tax=Arundo donax TaxID=35708 RepID=A0A0A9FWM5_ARUDO